MGDRAGAPGDLPPPRRRPAAFFGVEGSLSDPSCRQNHCFGRVGGMSVRVGINGFGRIGRNFFRAATERGADIDFVAVNDVGSLETMAHLLKYDSLLGILPQDIRASKNGIKVGSDELLVLSERDPKELPWDELGVDLVIESTGIFTPGRRPPPTSTPAPHSCSCRPRATAPTATFVYGRQPPGLRPQDPAGHLGRQLHHQLLRADGQGARRRVRHRAGPDDDGARLHRRPDARRRAAQGSPPGPRRGDQHRADQHRRRPLHRRSSWPR